VRKLLTRCNVNEANRAIAYVANVYAEEKDKGIWKAIQWMSNMSGSTVGGFVALGFVLTIVGHCFENQTLTLFTQDKLEWFCPLQPTVGNCLANIVLQLKLSAYRMPSTLFSSSYRLLRSSPRPSCSQPRILFDPMVLVSQNSRKSRLGSLLEKRRSYLLIGKSSSCCRPSLRPRCTFHLRVRSMAMRTVCARDRSTQP
jgi:hypothetical protein